MSSIILDRVKSRECRIGGYYTWATKTGYALGSVYSFASTGAVLGVRWMAPVSGNLTDVYFFVTATTGTPGVTTVELRNASSGNTKPGTSLLASQTVSPGVTANKWIKCTFSTPYSVTVGTVYWIVFGDAGWTTGNTVTIDSVSAAGAGAADYNFLSYTTADGFNTNGTGVNTPAVVLKFADGSVMGSPITIAGQAYASNTRERGIRITGLIEDLYISSIEWLSGATSMSGIKIYPDSSNPGGTTLLTQAGSTNFGTGFGLTLTTPFKLFKNTAYRIVITFGSSSTGPNYAQIEDYATGGSDLTNAWYGGCITGIIDNGSGGWTETVDQFTQMSLVINNQVAQMHSRYIMGLGGS